MVKNIAIGTGRRKTAVARVFVRDGSGKIVVIGKDVKDYFCTDAQVQTVNQPLLVTSMGNKYDILINVTGGGLNGQAAACLHGISRALVQIDEKKYSQILIEKGIKEDNIHKYGFAFKGKEVLIG